MSVSTGHDVVSGSTGEDNFSVTNFNAAGTASPSLDVSNFSLSQGDVLDVSGVLAVAGYTGNNLSNYLTVAQEGSDTLVSVTSGGIEHLVADLRGVTASGLVVDHGLMV